MRRFWAGWALVGLAAEAFGANPRRLEPGTLSTCLRSVVHRNRTVHRATLGAFIGFSVWFAPHIWGKR